MSFDDTGNQFLLYNSRKVKKTRGGMTNNKLKRKTVINNNYNPLEEDIDEIIDGDEGIVNRRLPLNSYNH